MTESVSSERVGGGITGAVAGWTFLDVLHHPADQEATRVIAGTS